MVYSYHLSCTWTIICYHKSALSPANAFPGAGKGGGSEGVVQPEFNPGEISWSNVLSFNGTYDAPPDDPNDMTGILAGPAGTHGHGWQKTTGVRIKDLPPGSYEVYASAVPYGRYFDPNNGPFGTEIGDDVSMYIGTIDETEAITVLEDDVAAGRLKKTLLTHNDYTNWVLGDNYGRGIVTVGANEALMIGLDGILIPTFGIATIEIREVSFPLAGDFDLDGDVDGADFLKWQRDLGDAASLADWEINYGFSIPVPALAAVPEPASVLLTCVGMLSIGLIARHRRPST